VVSDVLESLLMLCHTGRKAVYVQEVAEWASTVSENRGEYAALSAKAVGRILLQEVGLTLRRQSAGSELTLGRNIEKHIHSLAHACGLLKPIANIANCSWCQEMLRIDTNATQSAANKSGEVQ